jgi:hypothetical protein
MGCRGEILCASCTACNSWMLMGALLMGMKHMLNSPPAFRSDGMLLSYSLRLRVSVFLGLMHKGSTR